MSAQQAIYGSSNGWGVNTFGGGDDRITLHGYTPCSTMQNKHDHLLELLLGDEEGGLEAEEREEDRRRTV